MFGRARIEMRARKVALQSLYYKYEHLCLIKWSRNIEYKGYNKPKQKRLYWPNPPCILFKLIII